MELASTFTSPFTSTVGKFSTFSGCFPFVSLLPKENAKEESQRLTAWPLQQLNAFFDEGLDDSPSLRVEGILSSFEVRD